MRSEAGPEHGARLELVPNQLYRLQELFQIGEVEPEVILLDQIHSLEQLRLYLPVPAAFQRVGRDLGHTGGWDMRIEGDNKIVGYVVPIVKLDGRKFTVVNC